MNLEEFLTELAGIRDNFKWEIEPDGRIRRRQIGVTCGCCAGRCCCPIIAWWKIRSGELQSNEFAFSYGCVGGIEEDAVKGIIRASDLFGDCDLGIRKRLLETLQLEERSFIFAWTPFGIPI